MEQDVAALIDDLGRPMTLRRIKAGVYDPETSKPSVNSTEESCFGFMLDYKDRDRDGTVIKARDRKAVIRAANIPKPATDDKIICDGVEYLIVSVRAVEKSGVALIYSMQVRG